MFFKQLPSYRPSAIYADLLIWHQQVMARPGKEVPFLDQRDFDLVIARAELAGTLQCAGADAPTVRQEIEEIVNRFRSVDAGDRPHLYWELHAELVGSYWPEAVGTILNYVGARLQYDTSGLRSEVEAFGDKLPDLVDQFLLAINQELIDACDREECKLAGTCFDCKNPLQADDEKWYIDLPEGHEQALEGFCSSMAFVCGPCALKRQIADDRFPFRHDPLRHYRRRDTDADRDPF